MFHLKNPSWPTPSTDGTVPCILIEAHGLSLLWLERRGARFVRPFGLGLRPPVAEASVDLSARKAPVLLGWAEWVRVQSHLRPMGQGVNRAEQGRGATRSGRREDTVPLRNRRGDRSACRLRPAWIEFTSNKRFLNKPN